MLNNKFLKSSKKINFFFRVKNTFNRAFSCLTKRNNGQFVNPFIAELGIYARKIERQFVRPSLPSSDLNKKLNLHLGCGSVNHPDFVNVDGIPAPHVHYVRSLSDLSPFKNETVDMIYASHCLEHFKMHEVPTVLKEWFRVLKKEGILRLSVPDFDCLVSIYIENNRNLNLISDQILAGQKYKYDYHLSIFNKEKITELLLKTGFETVEEWFPGKDKYANFNDFSCFYIEISNKKYPVSLNVDAVK